MGKNEKGIMKIKLQKLHVQNKYGKGITKMHYVRHSIVLIMEDVERGSLQIM
jgi:hypothetical protein